MLRFVTLVEPSGLYRPIVLPFHLLIHLKVATDYLDMEALLRTTPNLEGITFAFGKS